MAGPDRQEKAMSMNHDLTTRLARDHQRQMLAEASHQPRRPAPQAPRTVTQIIRGLAGAINRAGVVTAQTPGVVHTAPDRRVSPDLHVPGITGWAVTDAGRS
jgi:hypothetical protein